MTPLESEQMDHTKSKSFWGITHLAWFPRIRLLGTCRVRMRLSIGQRQFQGLSYRRRYWRFGMGMRASSLSVPRRLCCSSKVVRRVRPRKASSSTWEIWFCCKSRLVKLSYPKKAPSRSTLMRLRARRRCLGSLDQVCELGMEVKRRSWQSTKTSPESVDSEQSGATRPEGPDLLWRPTPLALIVFKHKKFNSWLVTVYKSSLE